MDTAKALMILIKPRVDLEIKLRDGSKCICDNCHICAYYKLVKVVEQNKALIKAVGKFLGFNIKELQV